MRLICITGIDGAGKTTLAKNMVKTLNQEGKPAVYIYGRTIPVVSRFLMALGRATLLRNEDIWDDYEAYSASKKQTMRNKWLAYIYTVAVYIDYYPQIWWKLFPHLFSRRYVVCDRYIYDTVISDLAVHLSYSRSQAALAIERGLRFLPTPTATVLIELAEDIAFARKDDMPHVAYLVDRRRWYSHLTSRPEVKQLDGNNEPETLLVHARALIEAGITREVYT